MIKASAQEDALAPAKPCKVPVTVQDLVLLADALAGDSPRDQAIFDTALVAFWSLVRLGEVSCATLTPAPK
jgi:hypothetical protein